PLGGPSHALGYPLLAFGLARQQAFDARRSGRVLPHVLSSSEQRRNDGVIVFAGVETGVAAATAPHHVRVTEVARDVAALREPGERHLAPGRQAVARFDVRDGALGATELGAVATRLQSTRAFAENREFHGSMLRRRRGALGGGLG